MTPAGEKLERLRAEVERLRKLPLLEQAKGVERLMTLQVETLQAALDEIEALSRRVAILWERRNGEAIE